MQHVSQVLRIQKLIAGVLSDRHCSMIVSRTSFSTSRQYLILVFGKFWQALQESHHVPYALVAVRWSPGRHARSLDSVFNSPELSLGGRVAIFGAIGMLVLMFITG